MKKTIMVVIILSCSAILGISVACLLQTTSQKGNSSQSNEIMVESVSGKEIVLIGTKEQIERTKKDMKELIDPADDIAINAWELYKAKKYDEAEKEALKAIREAKQHIVKFSAHKTLLDIYEATDKHEAAINEINWLLDNVNEHAKPELLQCKERLQKLLQEQQK